MVSRRNFFTIIILMLIMIFMFMFSSVVKQEFNEYDVNSYAGIVSKASDLKQSYDALIRQKNEGEPKQAMVSQDAEGGNGAVVYLGSYSGSKIAEIVKTWSIYTKRSFQPVYNLESVEEMDPAQRPEVLVVDGATINWDSEAQRIDRLVKDGMCVIFASLPKPAIVRKSETLRRLTGISGVYEESAVLYGLHLLPGFLVGSEELYEPRNGSEGRADLNLEMPWYLLGEGTKTYVLGTLKSQEDIVNQDRPPVIWRCGLQKGRVFCINGDYMSSDCGIGILTACVAEKDSYDIYPVVNAQNLVLANYGGFSDENHDELVENYDMTQIEVFRDLVWPTMVALNERTSAKISLMAAPQLDYTDDKQPKKDVLVYYLRLLKEVHGEAGVTTGQRSNLPIAEKLSRDLIYWQQEALNYKISSAYLHDMSEYDDTQKLLGDLKTVAFEKKSGMPVAYIDEEVTGQASTSNGISHTFSEDLATKALETSLGYCNITLDLSDVSFPQQKPSYPYIRFANDYSSSGLECWESLSGKITSNLYTYWHDFTAFDQTTLLESDARIRRFLALDYSDQRHGNEISLKVENFDETAYFILKLNYGFVENAEGAEVKDLKNGFYLLKITQPEVLIHTAEKTRSIH